ncbi:hypothetical protein LXL04_005811 [Taraxacum kok-saghyz]
MQGGGGRGRGNPFFGFGDPFSGFGDMPSLFGGRDPFDDPFFTRPFGGIFSGTPFMDLNPFPSTLFGPRSNPFINEPPPRIHDTRPSSLPNHPRGPIIEELNSDDENEQHDGEDSKKENPHGRSEIQQPYVQHPDDEYENRRGTQFGNDVSIMNHYSRPQTHSFSFQSSTVTYGGSNGAYHTASTTRRSGSDGLRFEEYKEADSVTGQAAHRLSRGIHDKGHTVSRNLKSNGHVDTMQVLHNINEDEVEGFEEAWKGKARTGVPSINEGLGEANRRGGWALPSTEHPSSSGSHVVGVRRKPDVTEQQTQSSKVRRC